MRLKYVIFKKGMVTYPILFPEHVTHSSVHIIEDTELKAVSAGFCTIDDKVGVFINDEESTSTKLKPLPQDQSILENLWLSSGFNSYIDYSDI